MKISRFKIPDEKPEKLPADHDSDDGIPDFSFRQPKQTVIHDDTTPSCESILHPWKQTKEELKERLEEKVPPPSIEVVLNGLLKQHTEYDLNKAFRGITVEGEIYNHEESRSYTRFYHGLKKYVAAFSKEHHDKLWKAEKELPDWMLKDLVIADTMKKTRLGDVLKALRKYSTAIPDRRREKVMIAKGSVERRKEKGHLPVCFITNEAFFGKILPELNMAKVTLKHYIIALRKFGAITKIDKKGFSRIIRNETLYCIGHKHDYPGGQKVIWILKEKMRKQFRNFKL